MGRLSTYITILAICSSTLLLGQDTYFINTNANLTGVNPSLLGGNGYRHRVGLNYRQSLNLIDDFNANRLYSAFYQNTLFYKGVDEITMELRLQQDNPAFGITKRSDVAVATSYRKKLFGTNIIHHGIAVGFVAGYGQLSPHRENIWFGTQYDIDDQIPNPFLPPGEPSYDNYITRHIFDSGLGLRYFVINQNGMDVSFGAAAYHLVDYNESIETAYEIPVSKKYQIFGSVQTDISEQVSFVSTAYYVSQFPFKDIFWRNLMTFNLDYQLENYFAFGLIPRWTEDIDGFNLNTLSIISIFQINYGEFEVSYDLALGGLGEFSDRRGNIEFSLSYYFGKELNKKYGSTKIWY